ncbi:hypothetical protein SDC9_198377 [bioreactor metagenome]|uniref:Protein translocase subunit SecA n=1 Tax=bioreactor metagenome TaxID=1076179 RepID=A0A645IQW0_9ZZZZ
MIGIIYLRDHHARAQAFDFCKIILSAYETAKSEVQLEFAAVFFLAAQLKFHEGNRKEALDYAGRAMEAFKLRDPNKSSAVISVPDVQSIKKELQNIIIRSTATPVTKPNAKIGRNERCPCGSGKKYKHCCGR